MTNAHSLSVDQALIELATLLAEVIRRMGAAYGSSEDWRRDLTRCVKIHEQLFRAI